AGARSNSDNILELVRFAVTKHARGQGYARKLLSTILEFAKAQEYQKLQVEPARQYPGGASALMQMGFTSDNIEDAQALWYVNLEP
ncbi:MAG: GNAT family N-acetyltransferase, partial [Candidatus Melainabacteria bacterium]|nr:GNAT family N-acetyltransferase [Candidatus Melainabacteria bacterium]